MTELHANLTAITYSAAVLGIAGAVIHQQQVQPDTCSGVHDSWLMATWSPQTSQEMSSRCYAAQQRVASPEVINLVDWAR